MRNWRNWVIVIGLALILVLANREILMKRAVITEGRPLFLELRPVDPRSIFQGDYMSLGFADDSMPVSEAIGDMPYRGTVILALDSNGIGRFARLDDGGALQPGEMRIGYRRYKEWSVDRVAYTSRSFFFQEGRAERYAEAKYALLRVAQDGASVLIDLTDKDRKPIGLGDPAPSP